MRLLEGPENFTAELAEWYRRFDAIKGEGFAAELVAKGRAEYAKSDDDTFRVNYRLRIAEAWILEDALRTLTCDEVEAFFGSAATPPAKQSHAAAAAPKTSSEAIRTYYALNEAGRTKEAAEFYARHRTLIFGNQST